MRIALKIEPTSTGPHLLPVNYQYPFSAWIYRVISQGDHQFSLFLHEHGYGTGNKSFKFFTFSMLNFFQGKYQIAGDRIVFDKMEAELVISFLVPKAVECFISGLFLNQNFNIGDRHSQVPFMVKAIEVMPEPTFSRKMCFRTLSPLLVSEKVDGCRAARYVHPGEESFGRMLMNNLINKYMAILEADLELPDPKDIGVDALALAAVPLLSTLRKKGIIIKADTPQQTQLIGYLFDFSITAPPQLTNIGYYAGFGEKNSLGMGCCEVINDIYQQ